MTAENLLPIINSLPEKEMEKLLKMLGVSSGTKTKKQSSQLTDGEATEYLVGMFEKRWKNNRTKKALRQQDQFNNK